MEDQYVQAMTIAGSDSDGSAGCKQICIHSLQEMFTVFLS